MKEKLIKLSKSFQNFICKYNDLIEKEINIVSNKLEIDLDTLKLDSIHHKIEEMEKAGKLLQIGIVGGVKAGKSSILNALIFDGKSILPKAATPMTASLTTLSYGEELEVNIEYFTKEDLLNIKNKAKSQVKQEMKNDEYFQYLKIAYDHYYMEDSNQEVDVSMLPKKISNLEFTSLSDQLKDFVGVKGKYTKQVKAVNIKIPVDIMRNLIIVDSPGINDPVESREKRTMELIKECDVIFLISRASQFLPKSDVELLERIQKIEGINEIYLIASQSDLALIGSIKEENDGNPFKAIGGIKEILEESIIKNNIQIGNKEIIVSSGGCYSLASKIEQQDFLDSNEETIKKNLLSEYSDYFSEQSLALVERLKDISNISEILDLLEMVRNKKDIILYERLNEFIVAKINLINKYVEELKNIINIGIEEIESNDLYSLKLKNKELKKSIESKKENIKSNYNDFMSLIARDIQEEVDGNRNNYKSNIDNLVKNYIKNIEEKITPSDWYDIKGHISFYLEKTRPVLHANTVLMNSNLITSRRLTQNYRNFIRKIYEKDRDKLLNSLSNSISSLIKDFETDEKNIIKNKLDAIYKNELENKIEITVKTPENKYNGNLKGYYAKKYEEYVDEYIKSFEFSINENFDQQKIELIFSKIDLIEEILSNITENYRLLEIEILNKENSLIQKRTIKESLEKI